MKVAWLLAAFIAIVTYTPCLTCSRASYIQSKRAQTEIGPIKCKQNDKSDKKALPQFLFLQRKGYYIVEIKTNIYIYIYIYNKITKLSGFNDNHLELFYDLYNFMIFILLLHRIHFR